MTNTISNVRLQLPTGSMTNQDLASNADIDLAKIAQRVAGQYPVPFSWLKTWDNFAANVPSSAAADDLGLTTGTPGTNYPLLTTGDLKAAGATSRKVGFELPVPANYDDGETFQIRINAGMDTTIADTSATVDLEVWASDRDGTPTAAGDLCTTVAQSANSLTAADLDFTIDASNLEPSQLLQAVITFAVNDGATGTAVIGQIYDIRALIDTRG